MATKRVMGTRFQFNVGEFTGAIGDTITVLPLIIALGELTPASLPHMLLGFAIFQVIWGLVYGVPLSVEPMKALAGLAIAGAIRYDALIAAGLLAGIVLFLAGRTGLLTSLVELIGDPVIRGTQFAVASLLVLAALELVIAALDVAIIGVGVAAIVAIMSRRSVALTIITLGGGWALLTTGLPTPTIPSASLFPTGPPALSIDVIEGLMAQLAMTVGNAAIATALLLSDLFDRDISADQLAESMGLMNLSAIPFGAFPMCHGSGGLAGKYTFGARTATANIYAGIGYAGLALLAGIVTAFPTALLGVLLVIVAATLTQTAFTTSDRPWFIAAMGGLAVITNIGIAFIAGALWWHLRT